MRSVREATMMAGAIVDDELVGLVAKRIQIPEDQWACFKIKPIQCFHCGEEIHFYSIKHQIVCFDHIDWLVCRMFVMLELLDLNPKFMVYDERFGDETITPYGVRAMVGE